MVTSQRGIDLIKTFEGFTAMAVKLKGEQYYTIGYGHYGEDVGPNRRVTQAEAEALLRQDLRKFEGYVNRYCESFALFLPNQNQFDALVSFTYNCGPGSLKQLITGRTAAQVATHILAYTKSGSPIYEQGLRNRRVQERALFLEAMEEEEDMTGEEIYKALQSYLKTLSAPKSMAGELQEAQDAGIWDGSSPAAFAPRYQVAAIANRVLERAKEQSSDAAVLALVRRIHELERENQDLRDEINVLHSDVHTAKEGG